MSALKKVLVVDDDPVIGKSFDRVLSRKGYMVINAADGIEALNKLANEEYDAVFTDIRMPGISGLEVAERVRAKRPWTPVVIITGYGSEAVEAHAKAAGVREFLRKPLSPDMIATSAAAILEAAPVEPTAAMPIATPDVELRAAPEPVWKTAGTMVAAPFAALAFVVLFPFIGMLALALTAGKALRRRYENRPLGRTLGFVRNVVLFFVSPFIALGYVMFFPVVGSVLLARTAAEAWRKSH
jgi:CheY-like chemotaxis protein